MATYFRAKNLSSSVQLDDTTERLFVIRHLTLNNIVNLAGTEIKHNVRFSDGDVSWYKGLVVSDRWEYVARRMVTIFFNRLNEDEVISAVRYNGLNQHVVLRTGVDEQKNIIWLDIWMDINSEGNFSDEIYQNVEVYTFGHLKNMYIIGEKHMFKIRDATGKLIYSDRRYPLKVLKNFYYVLPALQGNVSINNIDEQYIEQDMGLTGVGDRLIAATCGKYLSPFLANGQQSGSDAADQLAKLLVAFCGFQWGTSNVPLLKACSLMPFLILQGGENPPPYDYVGMSRGGNGMLIDVTNVPIINLVANSDSDDTE